MPMQGTVLRGSEGDNSASKRSEHPRRGDPQSRLGPDKAVKRGTPILQYVRLCFSSPVTLYGTVQHGDATVRGIRVK
jgi:hypothetical protein